MDVIQTPSVRRRSAAASLEDHHRAADLGGQADLGERAVAAADRDDGVAGADHGQVAGVADAGGDDVVEVGIGRGAVVPGKDADGGAAGLLGAAGGGLHDAAQTAADQGGSRLGDQPPDFLGQRVLGGSAAAAADDRDVARASCALGIASARSTASASQQPQGRLLVQGLVPVAALGRLDAGGAAGLAGAVAYQACGRRAPTPRSARSPAGRCPPRRRGRRRRRWWAARSGGGPGWTARRCPSGRTWRRGAAGR